MASRNGRWVMVFNGEVYNFRGIRKDLEMLGHTFFGTGDSEVILEAFVTVTSAIRAPSIKTSSSLPPGTGWNWVRKVKRKSSRTGAFSMRP